MKPLIKSTDTSWRGYTLEELRYKRAETMARTEIEKYRLSLATERVKESTPLLGGSGGGGMLGLLSRSGSWISYLEYGLMAYRLFKRITPLFRKKRN